MATSVEPNSSPIMENNTALFSFIVQGIGITVVGSLGILGNIIGLFILTRPKMKSSITWFLLGLSTFDLLFLILCILIYGLVSAFEYLETGESYRALMDPENSPWLVTINDTGEYMGEIDRNVAPVTFFENYWQNSLMWVPNMSEYNNLQ